MKKMVVILLALLIATGVAYDSPRAKATAIANPTFFALWAWTSGWVRGLNATDFSNQNPQLIEFRAVTFLVNASWDYVDGGTHDFAIYSAGFPSGSVNTANSCSSSSTNGCLVRSATFGANAQGLHFSRVSFTPNIPPDDLTGTGAYEYYCEYHPSTMHGRIVVYKTPDVEPSDTKVDIVDIATIALAYGSKALPTPTATWNPAADIDNNGVVDIFDVATAALYYGQPF